jgi:hypothetical protein
MAKPKIRRMSEAEAEQIGASRNLNKKDEEAKAKVSTPQFISIIHCRNRESQPVRRNNCWE